MSVTTATSDFAPYIAAVNAMKRARSVAILAHNDIEFVRPCNLCPHVRRITLPGILLSLRRMATQVHVDTDMAGPAPPPPRGLLRVGGRGGGRGQPVVNRVVCRRLMCASHATAERAATS